MTTPNQDRARQTMASIHISTTHGQNVQVETDGKFASWKLQKHLGVCFTDRPLTKGESLKFKLTGSGHVLLGLLSAKPNPTAIEDTEATSIEPKGHWTHFRFKRETTSISLNRVKTREVEFTRGSGGRTETKAIPLQSQDVYVFFEIQFGDMTIDIESDQLRKPAVKFDESCGTNITLERQQSRALLKNANISALCCTDRPLAKGEVIDLSVIPIENANWTFIKLFISNRNASDLAIHKTETSFGRNKGFLFPQEGIKVDKKGTVQLLLTDNGEIAYSVRTEEKRVKIAGPCVDLSMPLFLCVELFRVRVGLESTLSEEHDDPYVRAEDRPTPDATDNDYLIPVHRPDDREHKYEKISSTRIAFPEIPIGRAEGPSPRAPVTPETTGGYVKMYPPGKERGSHDQETQVKCVSDDDSITELKKLNTDRPRKEPTPETPLPKGVKREVEYAALLGTDSADAEASGPVNTPPVPPRQRTSGSAGPEGPPYMNSLSPPGAMPLENILARVQVLEHTTGLPVPSVESPIGTSGEEVVPFAETIRKNYISLLNRLEPDPVADYLFQENKMSDTEHASFLEKDRKGKCRQILEILQKRPSTQGIFKRALNTSAQEDISNLLKL